MEGREEGQIGGSGRVRFELRQSASRLKKFEILA